MKKFIVLLMVVFIAGCGSKKSADKFEGIKSENNYVKQGMQYLQAGDVQKAVQSFDKAIKADPLNPENYLVLGQVYLRLNNFARASDSFAAAIKVSPDNGAAYYMLAQSQMLYGQREEAIKSVQRSVEIFKAQKDEKRFMNALVLLKSLAQAQPAIPAVLDTSTDQSASPASK
jgi:tetratricopeptide (TPR) repeat protein